MDTPADTTILPKRIFLIRHARPDLSKNGWFSNEAARKYITDYDTAAVEEFVLEHEAIPYKEIDKVYCSTLPRSQLTAKAIFGSDVQLKIDKSFREFERRIFSLPLLRMPIKLWLLSARVLWFLGFNSKDIETFKEAKQRARQCAQTLASDAASNRTTVLVAHGLLNNFIRRELKRMGWQKTLDEGHGYLSVTVMQL
ncbi:histidine phosphatase family protein [Pontibacter cellulosilyticus]|uniref:Histidine phosphatase family protein n=1 Tax=Pontibacter cellulosilyticus TaxID=1720253 RepID=A0A923NA60_9BACT|nr:histidine phosphatase family protein [Pontibacter cellulosilyticus]MBC5995029.1 histidine phosphatase family protein [Pontibacter cellulosilyticus]